MKKKFYLVIVVIATLIVIAALNGRIGENPAKSGDTDVGIKATPIISPGLSVTGLVVKKNEYREGGKKYEYEVALTVENNGNQELTFDTVGANFAVKVYADFTSNSAVGLLTRPAAARNEWRIKSGQKEEIKISSINVVDLLEFGRSTDKPILLLIFYDKNQYINGVYAGELPTMEDTPSNYKCGYPLEFGLSDYDPAKINSLYSLLPPPRNVILEMIDAAYNLPSRLSNSGSDTPCQNQNVTAQDTSDSLQVLGVVMMLPNQIPGNLGSDINYDYYVIISITNNGRNTIVFDTIKHSFDGGDIKDGFKGVSYSKDVNGWSIEPGKSIMFDFQTKDQQAEILEALSMNYQSKIRFSFTLINDYEVIGGGTYSADMPWAKELPVLSQDISKGYPLSFEIKTR